MVLSNVAERCVTVGGGARVGSRAFTERGLPSSSPLSSGERRVLFFPGAGSRRESRRYDRRARASPRVRARVRGSSLGDASPITQLDFRCVSRPRVLPNGETFPDRTKLGVKVKFRPESSTARACYNTFCMERQSDFVVSHSLATLSDSESSARKKSAGISNRRGRWGVFCMTLSHDCARAKKSTLISDSSGLLAFVGPEPFYHEKWPAYRHIVG